MWRVLTLFQFFLRRETKKLMEMRMFCLSSMEPITTDANTETQDLLELEH